MRLIFVGQGYSRKLFNLEHFLIYGKSVLIQILIVKLELSKCFITYSSITKSLLFDTDAEMLPNMEQKVNKMKTSLISLADIQKCS